MALPRARLQWVELDCHIAWCDECIAAHLKADAQAQMAARLIGIGPQGASAAVATVGDFRQFKNGAQFGSWLGLVPSQNASGGKTKLGRITRNGDTHLRTLFIQGANSAVMTANKRAAGHEMTDFLQACGSRCVTQVRPAAGKLG